MSINHRTTISWTNGGDAISGTINDIPNTEVVMNQTIPPSSTDLLCSFACIVANTKTQLLLATGDDMTVKTNSSGAADATIALKNGIPLVWHSTGGYPALANSPFKAVDVAKLYVSSTLGGTLQISVGQT